jgi:CheY-like chemotaxis protein
MRHILVVDDDRFIRVAVQKSLAASGDFVVDLCESGTDAVRQARAVPPDLVLLDVVMPGLNGPDTLRALRTIESLRTTPVVFFTANPDRTEINQLHALGASGVIQKPFDPATLAERLEGYWKTVSRPRMAHPAPVVGRLATELEGLTAEYAKALPAFVSKLKAQWLAIRDQAITPAHLAPLRDAVHGLHGGAATFQFEEITAIAGDLEGRLAAMIQEETALGQADRVYISDQLYGLEQGALKAAGTPPDGGASVDLVDLIDRVDLGDFVDLPPPSTPHTEDDRVLVVDDQELVRKRYRLALEASGFRVDTVESGEDALMMAQRVGYSLILMDLSMPGMGGFEAQRRLRQHVTTKHIPIIFMTAVTPANLNQVQQALDLGVSGFVPKSLPLPQLVKEIRNSIREPRPGS